MVKDSSKDPKSSLRINEFAPINFNSFLSPHGGASKNSGMHCIRALRNILNAKFLINWFYLFISIQFRIINTITFYFYNM